MRDTIFISHATPDDNAFVRWLGSRLTGLGYKVWADLFELKGGTPFWSSIEEAIRHHAIKVIFVVSEKSVDPTRAGVRNEISVADAVKKKLQDPGFIIPVRIDGTPFADFPIQIHQLNGIDFSRGWGAKLGELLDTLESAGVPKNETNQAAAFTAWRADLVRSAAIVEAKPEPVLTNLLPILRLPSEVYFYRYEGDQTLLNALLAARTLQGVPFYRLLISLDPIDVVQRALPSTIEISLRAATSLSDFLDGSVKDVTAPRKDEARRMIVGLLKQSIERHLTDRGLRAFDTSGGTAFFFPDGLIEQNKVNYVAANGRKTYKILVGKSERHKVLWHLAMKVNVTLGEFPVVRFKPYVCFSEDGQNPIADAKRTSGLRKRFCRNWWNPHWRQLQQAFTVFLADGKEEIAIGGASWAIAGALYELTSARSLPNDLTIADEPATPPEPDDFADDEIDDADDEEDAA